jgi:transposase-like protein
MANTPKLNHTQSEVVVEQYQAGDAVSYIAIRHGISAATVRSIVRRAGVTLRPVGRPRNKVATSQ